AARGSAGLYGLVALAVGNAAADLVDDLAQRDAHRNFDQAGVVDPPGERKDLGTLTLLGADRGEPLRPVAQDGSDVGERLDIVNEGGASPEALLGGIWRAWPRRAALALDRSDERRLLAADEGAGAQPDIDLEAEAAAADLVAQQAQPLGLADRGLQMLDGE